MTLLIRSLTTIATAVFGSDCPSIHADAARINDLARDLAAYHGGEIPLGDLLRRHGMVNPRATVTVHDPDTGNSTS